ncbi:MAG: hypothetical protein KAX18_02710 [Candidatus Lokiarchaeota archaeon]|nr:hypothetical protein [Candidatus Lokiarchaeota archaeon]
MEGFKIKLKIKDYSELNFENEDNTLNSLEVIKSEYLIKGIRKIIAPIIIIFMLIITSMFIKFPYPPQNFYNTLASLTHSNNSSTVNLDQINTFLLVFYWFLFSSCMFLVFNFIKSVRQKFTPSLLKFFKKELDNLGFKIQKRKSSYKIFLILNCISFLILMLVVFEIIVLENSILGKAFTIIILIYLGLSLTIPIIWSFIFDHYIINLNEDYYILIHPNYKIRRNKEKETLLFCIYFTSNRIAFKSNKTKKKKYSLISENRWLLRKRKFAFFTYHLNPYLHFHEFATPLNFQKQFLNIVLALQEWDLNK